MKFRKIGILGGMGPDASSSFYQKIISYCQKEYKAVQDTDFPPIILYSLPLEGFDETGVTDKELVLKQLIDGIKVLENAGSDFIVMPCNTIHYFIEELKEKSNIQIVSIIEETVKKIKKSKNDIVGLLASKTTLDLKLYQNLISKDNISYLTPTSKDHEYITQLILEIMGGNVKKETKDGVISIIKNMKQYSATAVILGCTELPLAIKHTDVDIEIFDTLQILAESAVNHALIE